MLYHKYLTPYIRSHFFEGIHALKAAIAVMMGYVAYCFIPNHADFMPQWIIVTIIVVMSAHSSLGGQINKAIFRAAATLTGGLLAVLNLITPWHHTTLPLYLFVGTSIFVFIAVSYARYSYVGSLGIITFVMISLSAHPSLQLALARTGEVLLGISISLFVSRFVFPIRSIKLIKQRCFINILGLTELYQHVLVNEKAPFKSSEVITLESSITENISIQQQLLKQFKYETKKDTLKKENIDLIIRSQSALYRYFNVIEVSKRPFSENHKTSDIALIKLNDFILTLIQFLTEFVKNYPDIPNNTLKEMQEKNHLLQQHAEHSKHQGTVLSALHTLCFITNRITHVCERITKNIHIIQ